MIETLCPTAVAQVRALGKDYAGRAVLDAVSLQVEPGSIVGLIGRNGAGKSTLLRCMLGLLRPDHGHAHVLGASALSLTDKHKSALSYVPQQPDSFAWMTVGVMLDFVGSLYPHWDKALVQRLLQRWQLDPKRALNVLSPGQRQQVALIRALASRPRLLVLDEPASALDPLARRELLCEIVDCASEQGATVIFSTHIISDLERIASHIALLDKGRLRLHASLDVLKDELRRIYLPGDVGLSSELLPGEMARRRLDDGSWSLLLRLPECARHQLPANAQVQAMNLEDLFVELAR